MPLLMQASGRVLPGLADSRSDAPRLTRPPGHIDIGLVNNMGDAALGATERQFARVLAAASGDVEVRLHLFSIPEMPRGATARRAMAGRYGDLAALERTRLDGLIVTGAEPVAASLAEEPYWASLTRLVDWAEHNTASTVWSCLAAHAAVLHLDGIARRRLPFKRSGLFECLPVSAAGLLDGAPPGLRVPHSRWNDLAEGDLRAHGYRIASRSLEAGIDCFTKQWGSLFVFLQGHPEYDTDTLFREFRRDVHRYLACERDDFPPPPAHYFDPRSERAIEVFAERAVRKRDPSTWQAFPRDWTCRPALLALWRASAYRFYRNWLGRIVEIRG